MRGRRRRGEGGGEEGDEGGGELNYLRGRRAGRWVYLHKLYL